MRIRINIVEEDGVSPGVRRAVETMRDAFQRVPSNLEAVDSFLLRAPGGAVFSVTVDDAGALQVTQVDIGGSDLDPL